MVHLLLTIREVRRLFLCPELPTIQENSYETPVLVSTQSRLEFSTGTSFPYHYYPVTERFVRPGPELSHLSLNSKPIYVVTGSVDPPPWLF